jgi:hypothetical protein
MLVVWMFVLVQHCLDIDNDGWNPLGMFSVQSEWDADKATHLCFITGIDLLNLQHDGLRMEMNDGDRGFPDVSGQTFFGYWKILET